MSFWLAGQWTRWSRSAARCPITMNYLTNVWSTQQREDLARWMEKVLPVERTGEAGHVAAAAIGFMGNPYISGAVLTVDGGLRLQ